ncbi:MAG: tRNA/rRNA cytosine-C5-methylase, partial [Pseudomonadota bacterium]|nr:tRNA/rRNA cytosine-C5-methylase [Pseudomonadota bacterium]
MTPAARIAAVIDILSEAPDGVPAGTVLRRGLQQRRYAGSGDRQAISALFWTIYRAAARIGWHLEQLGAESTPRTYVLAALRLADGMDSKALATMFGDDDRHGPASLDAAEARLADDLDGRGLDDPAMPVAVRLEWPEALVDDTGAALGEALESELEAMRGEAGTDIRINQLKLKDRRQLRDRLAGRGMKCHPTKLSP